MTAVILGRHDPLDAADGPAKVCSAMSDRVPGALSGFVCTRAPEHAEPEHVASGYYPGAGSIAVAAWVDGGAPRVIDRARIRRAQRGEQS